MKSVGQGVEVKKVDPLYGLFLLGYDVTSSESVTGKIMIRLGFGDYSHYRFMFRKKDFSIITDLGAVVSAEAYYRNDELLHVVFEVED
jgi:hypothetical protein